MQAFPKIFAIGTDYIRHIFDNDVEVTEKLDGSQFTFGKINGNLYLRSKSKQLFPESPEKMFELAIRYVQSIEYKLPDNMMFYCEYLQKPKHNVLSYSKVPVNNLALFGAMTWPEQRFENDYNTLCLYAEHLSIDVVALLYRGKVHNVLELKHLLDIDSALGNAKIEGFVVKNYDQQFLLGGQPLPLMAGKFVSEKFKEVMRSGWSKEHTVKGKWGAFKDSYRTEARWHKAVQHLRDNGELENSPKDIGSLIKEIQRDITDEEKEIIKEFLWNEFGKEVLRKSIAGFPEWYKEQLMARSFE